MLSLETLKSAAAAMEYYDIHAYGENQFTKAMVPKHLAVINQEIRRLEEKTFLQFSSQQCSINAVENLIPFPALSIEPICSYCSDTGTEEFRYGDEIEWEECRCLALEELPPLRDELPELEVAA